MPVPTKAQIKTEVLEQLADPSVSPEVKELLKRIVNEAAFDDRQTQLSKAWAALQTRELNAKKTQMVLGLLRGV